MPSYHRSHEDHKIMTKINFSDQDHHETKVKLKATIPSGDLHESGQKMASYNTAVARKISEHGLDASGSAVHKTHQGRDTLVPSRRLIALVNSDPTFVEASRHIGLFPQVAYKLVRDGGVARVKQVTDFILSLVLETPYFQVSKDGQYDPSIEGIRKRARNMLISMALSNRPILEKYAGPSYFRKWPKQNAV